MRGDENAPLAAVLAAGDGAALSHASAAAAWGLRATSGGAIHVTVQGNAGRKLRPGLRIHRSITLSAHDVTTHRGIPMTTPECTIVDLARTLNTRQLERLIDLADRRHLIDFDVLRQTRRASLQAVLRSYAPAPTRSELEQRLLELCGDLIVAVDGYAYHRSPHAFETERERDVTLTLAGWQVMRLTWRHVTERPAWVAAAIR
jgi:hypothetical protein